MKPKPIVTRSHTFSSALIGSLHRPCALKLTGVLALVLVLRRSYENRCIARTLLLQRRRVVFDIKSFLPSGLPLRDFFDELDEPKRAKDDVNAMKDRTTVTSEQQLSAVTRRKQAYKAAFTSLSAVSMFTFYCDPLPAFDFLFLFIYCNLLILLITF